MPPVQEFERGGLAASEAQHQILISLLRQAHSPHYQPPGGSGTYLCRGESGKGLAALPCGTSGHNAHCHQILIAVVANLDEFIRRARQAVETWCSARKNSRVRRARCRVLCRRRIRCIGFVRFRLPCGRRLCAGARRCSARGSVRAAFNSILGVARLLGSPIECLIPWNACGTLQKQARRR